MSWCHIAMLSKTSEGSPHSPPPAVIVVSDSPACVRKSEWGTAMVRAQFKWWLWCLGPSLPLPGALSSSRASGPPQLVRQLALPLVCLVNTTLLLYNRSTSSFHLLATSR